MILKKSHSSAGDICMIVDKLQAHLFDLWLYANEKKIYVIVTCNTWNCHRDNHIVGC